MAVTIKDIAKEAGVSFQAVSAALNDTPGIRISTEKRQLIRSIAERLGYRRNFGYSLLRNLPTGTVAILFSMPRLAQEERLRILALELMSRFNDRGIGTYYFNRMTDSVEENIRSIRNLISRGAEHFIFIGTPVGHPEIQEELKRCNRYFIGFGARSFERFLDVDSERAVRKIISMVRHKTGENFCVLIPGPWKYSLRFRALKSLYPDLDNEEVIRRYWVSIPKLEWFVDLERRRFRDGWEAAERALKENPQRRGFVFLSDTYALGGGAYLESCGFKVGEDVLVAGFNADYSAQLQDMPVITAQHPLEEIVEILMREAFSNQPFQVSLDWEIITGNTFYREMKGDAEKIPENV